MNGKRPNAGPCLINSGKVKGGPRHTGSSMQNVHMGPGHSDIVYVALQTGTHPRMPIRLSRGNGFLPLPTNVSFGTFVPNIVGGNGN